MQYHENNVVCHVYTVGQSLWFKTPALFIILLYSKCDEAMKSSDHPGLSRPRSPQGTMGPGHWQVLSSYMAIFSTLTLNTSSIPKL